MNTRRADHRADIYSLGCTLYFLLTGQPLFGGETVMERLVAHREHPVPSLRKACPAAPPWLDAVFRKMVAKKPEDRYQSVTDVVSDLARRSAPSAEEASHAYGRRPRDAGSGRASAASAGQDTVGKGQGTPSPRSRPRCRQAAVLRGGQVGGGAAAACQGQRSATEAAGDG